MDLNRYTQKAQEAIVQAQQLAQELNHQNIEPGHLLLALLTAAGGRCPGSVVKVAGSAAGLPGCPRRPGAPSQSLRRRSPGRVYPALPAIRCRLPNAMRAACRTITFPPSISFWR
jgi:hypothetical protein